jgi:hypothetical protein
MIIKNILTLVMMISLMSCALLPEAQERSIKKPKRSELIRSCVFQLSDSHGIKEATNSCLKIYSRKEMIIE